MDFANLEEFTISSETGRAPLHFFCKHGRHCAVCKIIKEQPSSVGEADSRGRTPLHEACLLYTSPSPRDATLSRMPSSA